MRGTTHAKGHGEVSLRARPVQALDTGRELSCHPWPRMAVTLGEPSHGQELTVPTTTDQVFPQGGMCRELSGSAECLLIWLHWVLARHAGPLLRYMGFLCSTGILRLWCVGQVVHGMWDLSSPNRDQTWVPGIEKSGPSTTGPPEVPEYLLITRKNIPLQGDLVIPP